MKSIKVPIIIFIAALALPYLSLEESFFTKLIEVPAAIARIGAIYTYVVIGSDKVSRMESLNYSHVSKDSSHLVFCQSTLMSSECMFAGVLIAIHCKIYLQVITRNIRCSVRIYENLCWNDLNREIICCITVFPNINKACGDWL